jgi:signal peptidase II
MKKKYKLFMFTAALILIADQVTKLAILRGLELGARVPIIGGFFDIVHFRNTGAAFGMFSNMPDGLRVPLFYGISVVAAALIILYLRSLKDDELGMAFALSLVFGGMIGNVFDRIRLGSVVDFLSLHIGDRILDISFLGWAWKVPLEWPAFNVADSAITVAIFILLWQGLFRGGRERGLK